MKKPRIKRVYVDLFYRRYAGWDVAALLLLLVCGVAIAVLFVRWFLI